MDVKQLILSVEYLRMPPTSCILLLRVTPSGGAKGEALRKVRHWAGISFSGWATGYCPLHLTQFCEPGSNRGIKQSLGPKRMCSLPAMGSTSPPAPCVYQRAWSWAGTKRRRGTDAQMHSFSEASSRPMGHCCPAAPGLASRSVVCCHSEDGTAGQIWHLGGCRAMKLNQQEWLG